MNQTKTISAREEVLRKALALLASFALAFSLVPAMTFTAWADEPATLEFTEGVATITSGGTYQLAEGVSGVVKVNTTEAVTIVGNGATWDDNYTMTSTPNSSLYFDCTNQAGVNLTLKNVYITNSNAITCTDSSGCGVAGFKGTGNVLSFEGINVVEYNIAGGSNPAAIHVKQGDSLTVGGSGALYFYKSAQGSGFGGSSGELNGDITFKIANMFAKGTKQGALIGAGSGSGSVQTAPGSVTFESGSYNLISNSRGAVVGGAAGSGGASSGTVVNVCKNANVNINVDFTGAAVGGGGYAEGNDASGGILYVTGGSLRAYIDTNAASSTGGYSGATYTAGINDAAITAQRLNADEVPVYKCVVDTAGIEANEDGDYVVTVDGEEFYVGGLHEYGFVQEGLDKNLQLAITSTPSNWYENDDTCLYLYLTGADHEIYVNGVAFDATYDEGAVENGTAYTAGAFAVSKAPAPSTITMAAELKLLADEVNAGDNKAGKTYTLGADIDLAGIDWAPIGGDAQNVSLTIGSQDELQAAIDEHGMIYDNMGNSYKAGTDKNMTYVESYSYYYVTGKIFSGTFDGAGHEITGLNVNVATGYAGLFGNVNGIVKDLAVSGSVTSTASNGDFVGSIAGKLSEGGTISGVTSNVTVTANKCYNVGGITGFNGTKTAMTSADNTVIENCVNNGAVTGYSQVGGIAGENAGIIKACANNGKIDGVKYGSKNGCAGIAGRNGCNNAVNSKGTIIDCYNTGTIGNSDIKWVGGIAGFSNGASVIENCYNVGTVLGAGQTNPLVGQGEANASSYEGAGVYNSWYLDSTKVYDESGVYGGTQANCGPKTDTEMKEADFVVLLNADRETVVWNIDAEDEGAINEGYPVLAWQGGVEAATILLGDVNEDGVVNNVDAAVVYAMYNGKVSPTESQATAADVNGDGVISNVDAAMIYAFYNGKIESF